MSELFDRLAHHADNPRVAQLTRVPLFEHVPRRQLALIAANLDEATAGPGETLVREGHHNDTFWILLEGEADLIMGGERHRTIGPGGFFGATSMLDGRPAVGTVVTRTPIRALVASAAQFRALEGSDTVMLRLMSAALERMREDLEIQRGRTGPAPA
ncbi:MAG TPA: cyclic nucleotide-binding domain-containing protein [Candidatus Dormibacteraeota bacterium]|nr:cyclic nucleotide-binding domain-containing protein [Candidatus Dormibacteraeota bacterium]